MEEDTDMSYGTPIGAYFVDTVTLVTHTRGSRGGKVYSGQTEVRGRVLDHQEKFINERNEETQTDSIAHFPADTPIVLHQNYIHNGTAYRVERFIRAKKGKSTTIEFIKVYAEIDRTLSGVS